MSASSGRAFAYVGHTFVEAELSEPVRDDALKKKEPHQAKELLLRERSVPRDAQDLRARLVERVVLGALLRRHLDRDARIGPTRQLFQHLATRAAHDDGRHARSERAEVLHAAVIVLRLRAPTLDMERLESPLRRQRDVVDPIEDGSELVESILHRRPGEDEPVFGVEALHRLGRLRRVVLDALRFVDHDDVGRHRAHPSFVAEELLVIEENEARAVLVEEPLSFVRRAVEQGHGRLRDLAPFAKPLRLQARGDDDEPFPNRLRREESVASRDRLHGLPEAHVVGEEESPHEGSAPRLRVGTDRACA